MSDVPKLQRDVEAEREFFGKFGEKSLTDSKNEKNILELKKAKNQAEALGYELREYDLTEDDGYCDLFIDKEITKIRYNKNKCCWEYFKPSVRRFVTDLRLKEALSFLT